jgi:hypothetical protein
MKKIAYLSKTHRAEMHGGLWEGVKYFTAMGERRKIKAFLRLLGFRCGHCLRSKEVRQAP